MGSVHPENYKGVLGFSPPYDLSFETNYLFCLSSLKDKGFLTLLIYAILHCLSHVDWHVSPPDMYL